MPTITLPPITFPIVTGRLASKVLDRERDDYLDHPLGDVLPDLRDSPWLE